VKPGDSAFKAAATDAEWSKTSLQMPPKCWNIFHWTYANGGNAVADLDHAPMSTEVVAAIEESWGDIKDAKAKPVAFK